MGVSVLTEKWKSAYASALVWAEMRESHYLPETLNVPTLTNGLISKTGRFNNFSKNVEILVCLPTLPNRSTHLTGSVFLFKIPVR